jgi:large subunit ribosomal protein L33
MAKTGPREKIMMLSTGTNQKGKPTGTYYTTMKNKRNTAEKLELRKFDRLAYDAESGKRGMHVTFKEKKLPK